MSKSTVRKEPTLAEYSGDRTGTSAATIADEFERFFSENMKQISGASAQKAAPQLPAAVTVLPSAQHAPASASPQSASMPVQAFDDPLMAELARIVGPGAVGHAGAKPLPQESAAAKSYDPLAAFEEELRRFDAMHRATSTPQAAAAPVSPAVDPLAGLEAEFRQLSQPTLPPVQAEADLRGAQGDPINVPPAPHPADAQTDFYAQDYQQPVPDFAEEAPKPRSRKVVAMLSVAAAVALIGVVGAVLSKGGKRIAGEPPVIAAKTQPMKEKPADPGGAEIPGQDRQVLAKGQEEPKGPATVVSKEEQPVDLNQTPKREVARVIMPPTQSTPAGSPIPMAPILMPQSTAPQAAPVTPPAPVVTPPAPAAAPAPTAGGFEAKRVRSVKVGADGDAAVTAPPPPPPVAVAAPKATVAAPAPTPQRIDPPKSESRPSTAARAPQSTTTPQPARTAARANPAPAPVAESSGENAPMSLRPPSGALATRPVARTTTPPAATTASTGSGKFAVQLGAPPTQEEAQRMATRLKQQHASALGGASPGVRSATVGEKTVYRVRVGGLSRDAANEMCTRIKSNGGSCFVAGN